MKKITFLFIFLIASLGYAQCPDDNIAFGASTPTCNGLPEVLTTCIFGGEYRAVDVIAGNDYTFDTCGDTAFDTVITVYDSGGALLAFNDDFCGLQSSVSFTACATETVRVLVDEFPCSSNTTCMTLNSTCTPGCAPSITCPADIVVSADPGMCDAGSVFLGTPVTGGCPGEVVSNDAPPAFPVGVTIVTWTVTTPSGCMATCTQMVTVLDVESPSITCPPDVTVECGDSTLPGGGGGGTVTEAYSGAPISWPDTGAGSTGLVASPTADTSGSIPAGSVVTDVNISFDIDHSWDGDLDIFLVSPDGTSVEVFTDPICGGSSSQDNVSATFDDSGPGTVNALCGASSTPGPHESCPGDYVGSSAISGTFMPNSPFSAFNGESADGIWTLEINDDAGGDGGCLHNFSVEVTWAPPGTGTPTTSDNCPGETVSFSDTSVPGCGLTEVITRTWTVTDASGNTNTCTQTITVVDTTPPTASCPADITQNTDPGSCDAVVTYAAPTGTDGCGTVTVTQTGGIASGGTFPLGTTTNTFDITDECGNTSSCSFDVTIVDNEDPVITCPPDVSVECSTGSGGASGTTVATYAGGTISWPDTGAGSTGLVATPVATPAGIPAGATVTDINISFDIDHSWTGDLDIFLLSPDGTSVEVFTDPICAGSSSQDNVSATFDDSGPGTVNALCGSNTTAGPHEACPGDYLIGAAISGTFMPNSPFSAFNGETADGPWTLEINDDAGGDGGCLHNFSVEISWMTPPMGAHDTSPAATGFATATDNCPGVVVTFSDSSVAGCGATEVITRTWTATDAAGNTSQCVQTITVTDTTPPVPTCPADIMVNNDPGFCSAVVNFSPPTATDSCGGIASIVQTGGMPSGSAFPVGTSTITYEVTDDCGNTASCSFDIIVTDNIPPTIVCPGDVMTGTDPGVCEAVVNFADAIAFDECGVMSVTQTMGPPSGSSFPLGTTTIEFTATDVNGNSSTCTFDITVVDDEPPTSMICPADIVVDNDPGICGAVVTYPDPIVEDNCFSSGTTPMTFDQTITITNPALMSSNLFSFAVPSGAALTDATLEVRTFGDIDGTGGNEESWTIEDEDTNTVGLIGATGSFSDQCNTTLMETFMIPAATIDTWTGDGMIDFTGFDTAGNINVTLCGGDFLELRLIYDYAGPGGPTPYTVVSGLPSGSVFPVGTTTNVLEYTDSGGNSIQCSFDVTVNDTEAPVIFCQGEPAPTTDTVSTSPGLPITDANPTTFSTITVTDDVEITDLDVDLDISHTWVGDMVIELESPAGTVVTLFDGPVNFCSGDDILATLDDEATDPIDDECDAGVPTINGTFTPSSPLSAFDGESTVGDWELRITDTAGGDDGTLNAWGISYTHLLPGVPVDVILDANGMASIPASSLLASATDNCGIVSVVGPSGAPVPMTLQTTLAGGNGNFGNMFDINALNTVTLQSFDIHGDTGAVFDVEVYAKSGTHVGFEDDPGAWTLIGTAPGVVSNGDGATTPLNLMLGYVMNSGETHAFYVTPTDTSTGGFNYTNGTAVGNVFASDANIEFLEGAGKPYPFTGSTFAPRVFNGNILYDASGALSMTLDFTCDDVGINLIPITAIDAAGNESTCIATVNVIDDTDPILVCQDITIELGPDGTAPVVPQDLVDPAGTFEACGISVYAVDVTEVTCDDIAASPITVMLFVSDPSGNIAACTSQVTVVDLLPPEVTCPADQTVDPGPGMLFYPVPDYVANGDASATDNCTDPVTIFTQDPAPGTLLPDGVYTVTICATDEYGNEGCCTFELTVETTLGVGDNEDLGTIVLYPNPARDHVMLSNPQNIALNNVAIYDTTGRLIRTVDLTDMSAEKQIDIYDLASATYLFVISGDNIQITKQIIKE